MDNLDVATGLDRPSRDGAFWRSPALGGVELFRARFTTHRFAKHWHDGYALGVVVAGAEQYACRGRTWLVASMRTVIAINPGEVHDGAAAAAGGWTYRMLYPPASTVDRVASELAGRPVHAHLRLPAIDAPALARALARCHARMEDQRSTLASDSALLTWLAALLREHADLRVNEPHVLAAADPRLQRVREYIDARPDQDHTLRRLAHVAGIGPFHLLRSFSRAFGITPHAWLIQRRLTRAKRLVDAGTRLADAAQLAGFADQSHLANRFRRAYGMTLREYRRASAR